MSKLNPETDEMINRLLAEDLITESQSELLQAFFMYETLQEKATSLGISTKAFSGVLSGLKRRKILLRQDPKGTFELNNDIEALISWRKPVDVGPVNISDEERVWMLKNYRKYKRSEVAKKLGRSKTDVIRMAMALGIDQKN